MYKSKQHISWFYLPHKFYAEFSKQHIVWWLLYDNTNEAIQSISQSSYIPGRCNCQLRKYPD